MKMRREKIPYIIGHFLKTDDVGIFIVDLFKNHTDTVNQGVLPVGKPSAANIKGNKFQTPSLPVV